MIAFGSIGILTYVASGNSLFPEETAMTTKNPVLHRQVNRNLEQSDYNIITPEHKAEG
jgi:hypothetical protein